jgi:hypothetical protein
VLAFGDSDEDAQLLEGDAVIVTAKVRGKARHSSTISLVPRPDMQPTQIGVSIGQVPVLLILHRQRPAFWVGTKQYGTTATLRMAS